MALFYTTSKEEPTVQYFNFTPTVLIGGSSLALSDNDTVGYRMGHRLVVAYHLVFTVDVSANAGAITMELPFVDEPDLGVVTHGVSVCSNTQLCVAPAGYHTLGLYGNATSSRLRFAWTGDTGTQPLRGTDTVAGTKVLGGYYEVLLDPGSFSV